MKIYYIIGLLLSAIGMWLLRLSDIKFHFFGIIIFISGISLIIKARRDSNKNNK